MVRRSRVSEMRIEKALRFVEELSWLMKSYEGVSLKALAETLRENQQQERLFDDDDVDQLNNFVEADSHTNSLVGILPKIFTNPRWFASNSDIAEFAQSALGLRIPRWEKISKFEMIGHVVCRVALNEKKNHASLVKVLKIILSDKQKETFVTDMRKDKMSWNDIIRRFG